MTKSELAQLVFSSIPYSNQIKSLDLDSATDAIYFEWRGHKLRVGNNISVEEVRGSMLEGTNLALLMRHILISTREQIAPKNNA